MRKLVIMAVVLLGATACGDASEPAKADGPTGSAPAVSTPSVPATGIDPCTLLTSEDVALVIKDTPPKPHLEEGGDQPTCAWGDGEFRGVWLTVRPGEPAPGTRKIDIGGRQGAVVEELEYSCQVHLGVNGRTLDLRAVASDKTEWCPEAATVLGAAAGRVG